MKPGRGALERLTLLLPLVLSVLPLLILGADVSRAKERQRLDAQRAWVAETRLVGERLREVTTPSFWIEAAARRLRARIERSAACRVGDAAALQTELGHALSACAMELSGTAVARGPEDYGEPLLWAAPIGPLAQGQSATLFTGPGFQDRYRTAFVDLLREFAAGDAGPVDTPRAEARAKRMRTILGAGVSTQLFLPAAAGRPFAIIYQQQQGLAFWDVIRRRRGPHRVPVAAYLVIVPVSDDPSATVLTATCRQWRNLLGTRTPPRCWPAFLPLPGTRAAHGPATVHPRLRSTGARHLLGRLRQEFSIPRNSVSDVPPRVKLLADRIGQVIEHGDWWATVCPVAPLTARLGVLVAPAPPMATLPGEILAWAARVAVAFGWSAYVGLWWLRRRPPAWGVRGTLMLWFLGLAATPLALVVGAGERLNADLALNLQDALDRRLHQIGQQIESGSTSVDHRCWRGARAVARNQQLHRLLGRLPEHPRLAGRLVDACWQRGQRLGLDPILVVLTDGDKLTQTRSLPRADVGVINSTARLYHGMARQWFRERSKELARRTSTGRSSGAVESAASSTATVHVTNRTDYSATTANTLADAGGISTFDYAGHSTVRFYDVVRAPNGRAAVLFILWNPEGAGRRYMKQAIHRAYLGRRDCYLAAFRVDGIRITPVVHAGDPAGLALLRRDVRSWGIVAAAPGHRRMAFSGSRLPGYLWVVGGPTDAIAATRLAESARLATAVAILILLVIAGAGLLARWLASPIVRITEGLQRIASGDVTPVRLGEGRADELGEAGMVLDTMTGWLAERKVMSRFVAPQVLSVVDEVETSAQQSGEIREAVTLVSDIRGFTALAERHPPTAVFAMINQHIERMTRVIQSHGGVIDRFIGDAIQAVFYADATGPMVTRALLAAEGMCREHRALVAEREQQGLFGYEIGVGLDLGEIVTGVIGDPEVRLDLSALGEPMQRATDLESASRHIIGKPHAARPIVCSSAVRVRAESRFSFAPLPEAAAAAVDGWILAGVTAPKRRPPTPRIAPGVSDRTDQRTHADPAPAQRRPITGPSAPAWTQRVGALGIVLVLWLLPLLAVHDASLRAAADDDHRLDQSLMGRLDDDWARCERIVDPTTPIAIGFRRWLSVLTQKAMASSDPQLAIRSLLATGMASLSQRWPKADWDVQPHTEPSDPEPSYAASGTPNRVIEDEFPPDASVAKQLNWFSSIQQEFGPRQRSANRLARYEWATQASIDPNFGKTRRKTWDAFLRVPHNGRERLLSWFPLVLPPQPGDPVLPPGNWAGIRTHLWGVLMLWLDPDEAGPGAGYRFLGGQLAADGCVAAFVPPIDTATAAPWLHPAFRQNRQLRRLLTRGGDGFYATDDQRGWQVIVRHDLFGHPCRVILARPWQRSTTRESLSRTLAAGWTTMWLLLGGLALARVVFGQAPPRIPLRWQMCGAFLLVLLPALVLSFVTFERSFAAQRTQIESAQRLRLAQTVANVDTARQIYLSWSCAVVERIINRPGFIARLVAIEALPPDDRASASIALMDRFIDSTRRRGVVMGTPVFSGSEKFFVEVRNAEDRAANPWTYKILRQYSNRALEQLGRRLVCPDDRKTHLGPEMVLGMVLDDARNLMLGLMSPELFARMTVAPHLIEGITNFGEPMWVSVKHLRHPKGYRYSFQMTVETTWLDALWSTVCPNFVADPTGGRPTVGMGLSMFPAAAITRPYRRLQPDTRFGGYDARPCFDAQSAPLAELALLAPAAFTPIIRRIGRDANLRLVLACPGRHMEGLTLFASVPLGRLLAESDADLAMARRLLLGLLLLSVALALQAAAAFLRPVAALVTAARGIMAGDFSGRLPAYAGVEFAILAQAFNAMADGVESGRRLSRFVSGSVRDAARDAERHQTAMAGELRSAAIVFAGLGGFSQLARTVPAPRLIDMTNRHLRAMSPIIRAHGGDIDKFIGDKILAVFPVDPQRGPGAAVQAATDAAAAMQRIAAAGEAWQRPFGVGIVLGDVLAGIMGTAEVRLEFTVIGDTVNLASRLADVAMQLDDAGQPVARGAERDGHALGGTVIDDAAWLALHSPAAWQRLQLPPIKGKSRAVGAHWSPPPQTT